MTNKQKSIRRMNDAQYANLEALYKMVTRTKNFMENYVRNGGMLDAHVEGKLFNNLKEYAQIMENQFEREAQNEREIAEQKELLAKRISKLEKLGVTTSDAQGIVEAEELLAKREREAELTYANFNKEI